MRVTFRKSFERDLRKIREQSLRQRVQETIERIEAADTSQDIPNLERLSGGSGFGRIRIGDFRIGIAFEGDEIDEPLCRLGQAAVHLSRRPQVTAPPTLLVRGDDPLHPREVSDLYAANIPKCTEAPVSADVAAAIGAFCDQHTNASS